MRFDLDVLLHKYLTFDDKKGRRDIQCLMFVEVKTFGAEITKQQRDTLSLFSQVLRNRHVNINSNRKGRHALNHIPPCSCLSIFKGKMVTLRMFGGHLLTLERDDPENSNSILWDYKPISKEQLVQLLSFEIDPDSFRAMDWRRRYSDFRSINSQMELKGFAWTLNQERGKHGKDKV